MRLLSVACLSLAAKMEECKVPKLSKFEVDDFEFEGKVIQRMELLIMNTAEWRMASVTPFAFLPYFITKMCNESPPNALASKSVQLILTIVKGTFTFLVESWSHFNDQQLCGALIYLCFSVDVEITLVNHQPSVIAAAAILMALGGRLSREDLERRMKPIFCNDFPHIVSVYCK